MYRRDVLGIVAGSMAGTLGGSDAVGTTRGSATGAGSRGKPTPGHPDFAPLASLPIEGAREAVVGADGATVYLAVEDGFAVADVTDPTGPRLLAERRGLLEDAAGETMRQVQDVAVDGDRLLVMGPAHPGVSGPKAAILYDVSEPADPRRLAVHPTEYPIHNGTLVDGLAYLAANDGETNPVEIVEMEPGEAVTNGAGAGDSGAAETGAGGTGNEPRVLGRWSIVDADEAWADVPVGLRPIHDVIVDRDVAYCSYWDAGTWLVDVSDPAFPRALGRVGERSATELAAVSNPNVEDTELPGNHHSASVDESGTLLAVGHEAWDGHGDGDGAPGGIDLVDVSNLEAPRVLSTIEPQPTDDPSRGRGTWTSAHNFELRGDRLYSAWYQGGVRVHDVSDPAAPRELAAWRDPARTRFWTAQVAAGSGAGTGGDAGRGAVVASSANVGGDDPIESGLYTFPDPGTVPPASPSSRRVTATPGLTGFGVTATLAGGGLAWLLARRWGE